MREKLNALIEYHANSRNVTMPRIGDVHASRQGGIFSLLEHPGNDKTGPRKTGFVSVDNPDATAKWTKDLFEELKIPCSIVTPWNALGAFEDKYCIPSIEANMQLCSDLINEAKPAALVSCGKWALEMVYRLSPDLPLFFCPHPSKRGRLNSSSSEKRIELAYRNAMKKARCQA